MTWIKVCGITSTADAEAAIEAGVAAIGLVFATSPRQVTIEQAQEIERHVGHRVEIIGVFKDRARMEEARAFIRFDRLQIHGGFRSSGDAAVLRAIRPAELDGEVRVPEGETTLIDGSEGRGLVFDWTRVRARPGRFVIAGGLTPENVGEAIENARPFGVDVSSGVETSPGRKDPEKMRRFVAAVRRADGL